MSAFGTVSCIDFSRVAGIDEGLHVRFRTLEGLDFFTVFVEGVAFRAVSTGEVSSFAFNEVSNWMIFVGFGGKSADFEEDGSWIIEIADLGVRPLAVVLVAESGTCRECGGWEFGSLGVWDRR